MNEEPKQGLKGLRVLALESRRAPEMAKLIANYGGEAVVAPSMREVPIDSNPAAVKFARKLLTGEFDVVIFLTGVGTRALVREAEPVCSREELAQALRKVTVVARGPKPVAVLKELGVPIALVAPEPNTWREVIAALDAQAAVLPLAGRRVAVQEYGASNPELLAALKERGASVTRIPVYEWSLPEDTGPLKKAAEAIAASQIDVALFTTSVQIEHLLRIAGEMKLDEKVRGGLGRIVVGSIGPVTSDGLREHGVVPDFEPAHPKMGFLVSEAAQRAGSIREQKRRGAAATRRES